MGVAYVNVRVSKSLKEEVAWAIDKRLRVVSNKMLFKTVIATTKKLKKKSHFKFKTNIVCVAM